MMTSLLFKFLMLYLGARPLYAAPTILSQSPGAQGAAFGRAFVSVVQDPTALHWNPAGLAGAGGAVIGEHQFLYDGARYDYIGLSVPSRMGTFGMGALQLYRGGITARAAIDDPGYQVTASQSDYRAGFARRFGDRWAAGGAVNMVSSNLAGYKDRGFGADAGARYEASSDDVWLMGRPSWSAGAVIKNLLAPRLKLDSDPEILPRELRGGLSVSFDGFSRVSLNAGSIRKDRAMLGMGLSKLVGDTELRLGLGASYTLQDVLTLRLGLDDGFALGVGFKTADGRFGVDYALEDRPLAKNHRFTLTYRFLKAAIVPAAPAAEIQDEEYARAKGRSEALGGEAFAHGQELFKAQRYEEAVESLAAAALLKPEDRETRELHRRSVEVRQREDIRQLRGQLDQQASAGDAAGAYRTLAKLLRYKTADQEYLLHLARHMAEIDAASREAVSSEIVAAGAEDVRSALSRGLDAQAIADAAWLDSVAASTQAAAAARELGVETARSSKEHRKRIEGVIARARKDGQHGRALLAAFSLVRSYPDDASAARALDAARRDYAATLRLTDKDRIYVRKLYYLAAVAWTKKDAERARDLLDELRRRDATDADAAALMDAMVRAGAVYETFDDNGGGQ
ncbi:MAG: PorV/PorQ family protein [Elusimicrobiota bacterium]|nr:PorV/PorQ family protein [Elusimicrobiota bacterium]